MTHALSKPLPLLLLLLPLFFVFCETTPPNKPLSDEERESAYTYEELVKTNAAARLNQLGDSLFEKGSYVEATALYQQSMDSAAVQADSFLFYDSKLDIACVQDRLGEIKKAIKIAELVVEAFIRGGDSTRTGRAYNTLAGFYGKAGMPDKSIEATRKGFFMLKGSGSLIHRCAAYNQMAFTYSDAGRWAEALPLLDTALQLMEQSGILNQRPGMRLNLGDCHRRLGNWPQARQYLEAAKTEADSLDQAHIQARALERLSELAEATGDPSAALRLFRQAKLIRDSIFTMEKARSIQELEVQYETREKEQQILLLRANAQTTKTRLMLLLAVLLGLGAIGGLGWYIQRLKLSNASRLLAQKQEELNSYLQLLMDKNAQLLILEQNREGPPVQVTPKDDAEEDLWEGLYNNRILTDKDWESFKQRFEQIYPGYLQRLRMRFPEITGAEERLFLLIKVRLNSTEIADILGITANGVKKARQRLRRRLHLASEDDLDRFIKDLQV